MRSDDDLSTSQPRHQAPDPDEIATTLLPRVGPDGDGPRPSGPIRPVHLTSTGVPVAVARRSGSAAAARPPGGNGAAAGRRPGENGPPRRTDPERTARIRPRVSPESAPSDPADATMLMGRILPNRLPGVGDYDAAEVPPPEPVPRGVRVVPLRAVQTQEGYRSVYSDLTRTTTGSVVRAIVRTVGELCITLGLVVLLFAAYEVWGKTTIVNAHQNDLDRQLAQNWDGAPNPGASSATAPAGGNGTAALPPPGGNAIARLYIPRLGKQWVVVQGVTPADIRYAPGHYTETALPGRPGNFAVAGHRMVGIFWDLDRIQPGDLAVVETRTGWFVYLVTENHIVTPHSMEVIAPEPNQPGVAPDGAYLTMTTCNPKWDNYQRLIVHGELMRQQTRAQGRPAELGA